MLLCPCNNVMHSECLQSLLEKKGIQRYFIDNDDDNNKTVIQIMMCITWSWQWKIKHALYLHKKIIRKQDCADGLKYIPDWLMKKHTSSRKIGVDRSRKSLANSTITGNSVSSSSNCLVCRQTVQNVLINLTRQSSN